MMGQFYLRDPDKVPATWWAGGQLQVCQSHVIAFNVEYLSDTPLSHCSGEGEGHYHDAFLQKIQKMETGKWRSWKLNDGSLV